jgi:ABC-type antimicrobial peptide transport system permease subunit
MPDTKSTRYSLATHLKETFPEVANAIPVELFDNSKIEVDDVECSADLLWIDSSFFSMIDVKIVDGNGDFLIRGSKNMAVTQEKALQLFGNESPLGKMIKWYDEEYTVCAVVTGLPSQSNYPFDFLFAFPPLGSVSLYTANTLVELNSGIDLEVFKKKLYEYKFDNFRNMTVIPLTAVRYKDVSIQRNVKVKFQHLVIFAIAGSLVILCSLFNYLTLFICRFRIRQKEMALRVVFGASGRSLFALLSTEFIISLIIALLLGIFLIQTVFEPFRMLSGIKSGLSSVYPELLIYISVIISVLLLTFILVLAIFRRRNLNTTIHKSNKKLFRKLSIIVQLMISIGFAFCTIIIVKQMYHLHNTTDLGFAFKGRGSVRIREKIDYNVLENQLKQITELTETLVANQNLLPFDHSVDYRFSNWNDKPDSIRGIIIENFEIPAKYESYYDFQLIEGEMLGDDEPTENVLINESTAKALGWHKSVGKSFNFRNIEKFTVKGVIRDIHNLTPTISRKMPFFYIRSDKQKSIILFKYEGTWETCKDKIKNLVKEKYPEIRPFQINIYNAEEEYDKYLKSENTLLKLLTFVSLVCVIICVFGFVSLISLTCEERRKEIAIRKINGATIKDILDIFFKEYFSLLFVGAVIAFPLGYYIMRQWLESYVVQTPIDAWIYAVILLALIMSIVLCVGWKVYKTSRENPVEVIKN